MMTLDALTHTAVMINEAVDALNISDNGVYIDGTFGRGGHSGKILSKLNKDGILIGIDRDPFAVEEAKKIKDPRFSIIHGPFSQIGEYVAERGLLGKVDGVLLDLGVSSPQLDNPERGFSFMNDGPLDMRMDYSQGRSAAQWLMDADASDIEWVLRTFGEERFARRIANAIVHQNQIKPLERTLELAGLIAKVCPKTERHKHPATRTFQAIRIYINSELDEIKTALASIVDLLAPRGRLAVISFHSLEDRIVKRFIRQASQYSAVPAGLPLTEAQIKKQSNITLINKGKEKASAEEIARNPRARSAVLRIAERVIDE